MASPGTPLRSRPRPGFAIDTECPAVRVRGRQGINTGAGRARLALNIENQSDFKGLSMNRALPWRLFPMLPAALLAWTPAPAAELEPDKANIVLILDSSRSMWGQIDGIHKVVSARTVVGDVLKRYETRANLALVAYGHRQAAGCSDVEVLVPLGAHKAERLADAVNAIKPKGSTPIGLALETAANAARATGQRTSLVLISDGLDNCKGNPCAMAGALKAKAPNLTIHAIAFERKNKAELKALACIGQNSGGSFASATSELELHATLVQALDAAVRIPRAAPVTAAAPAAAPPPAREPNITTAIRTAPPLADPMTTGTVAELPPPAPVVQTAAPPMAQTAATGNEPPQPQPKPQAPSQPPSAAQPGTPVPVALSAVLTEGGQKIQSGLVWRFFEPDPGPDGRYKLITTDRNATPEMRLPPGEYLINAAYGLSHVTKKIKVEPGKPLQDTFVLNAGGLRLGAVLAKGQAIPASNVRYDIFSDETDQFGNREKVLGDAKPGLIIRLNAGAYHIVSVYGDANAIVRADVTVEPGRLTEATINHTAGKVTFKLVLQPGGEALADTKWNILTPGGDVVKESAGALPTHILAAGNYTVLARHAGKNYTREFTIEPGDTKQIEVVIR